MIQVFDNVISENDNNTIQSLISNNTFPWYINKEERTLDSYKDVCLTHSQFNHVLYNEEIFGSSKGEAYNLLHNKEQVQKKAIRSPHFSTFFPIIQHFIKHYKVSGSLYRMKLNCQYQDNRFVDKYNPIHIDEHTPHLSLLYYINESDGDTIFFKDRKEIQRVSPKKNRLVISEGIAHCSSNPIKTELRYVLNTVFLNK